jgi:hypothetical protein
VITTVSLARAKRLWHVDELVDDRKSRDRVLDPEHGHVRLSSVVERRPRACSFDKATVQTRAGPEPGPPSHRLVRNEGLAGRGARLVVRFSGDAVIAGSGNSAASLSQRMYRAVVCANQVADYDTVTLRTQARASSTHATRPLRFIPSPLGSRDGGSVALGAGAEARKTDAGGDGARISFGAGQ